MHDKFRNLFDRINRYRWAGFFLALPTAYLLISDANFVGDPRELWIRVTYRIGLVILLIAIGMDWWVVYTGRRKVKRMVDQRIKRRTKQAADDRAANQ